VIPQDRTGDPEPSAGSDYVSTREILGGEMDQNMDSNIKEAEGLST
jgi:hypothetical protein